MFNIDANGGNSLAGKQKIREFKTLLSKSKHIKKETSANIKNLTIQSKKLLAIRTLPVVKNMTVSEEVEKILLVA